MLAFILAVAGAWSPAPAQTVETDRLTAYILHINPRATDYAQELAIAILREAKRHDVEAPLLVAIVWSESYFQRRLFGASGEVGPWQLVPGLDYHRGSWYEYQQSKYGDTGYPSVDWSDLKELTRARVLLDLEPSTFMAAHLLAYHLSRCGRPSARCAARYNSGNANVRPGYTRALRRRARRARRALAGL